MITTIEIHDAMEGGASGENGAEKKAMSSI